MIRIKITEIFCCVFVLIFASSFNIFAVLNNSTNIVVSKEFLSPHPWYPILHPQQLIINLCYPSLLKIDGHEGIKGGLLQGIPQIVEDFHWSGKKRILLEMKLKSKTEPGKGVPLTGEDIKFSWQMGKKLGIEPYRSIDEVFLSSKDSSQVRFLLSEKSSPEIIWQLAYFRVVPKYVKSSTKGRIILTLDYMKKNPIDQSLYKGRYKVTEWKPGEYIHLTYNSNTPKKINSEDVFVYLETDIRMIHKGFLAGDYDVYVANLTQEGDKSLFVNNVLDKKISYTVLSRASFILERVAFSPSNIFFKDKRVRKALSLIIDLGRLQDNIDLSNFYVSSSFFPQLGIQSSANDETTKFDQARTLLNSAGWRWSKKKSYWFRKGKVLKLKIVTDNYNQKREKIAKSLKDQWKKLGISTSIVLVSPAKIKSLIKDSSFSSLALFANRQPSIFDNLDIKSKFLKSKLKTSFLWEPKKYFVQYLKYMRKVQSANIGIPLFFHELFVVASSRLEKLNFYNKINLPINNFIESWEVAK